MLDCGVQYDLHVTRVGPDRDVRRVLRLPRAPSVCRGAGDRRDHVLVLLDRHDGRRSLLRGLDDPRALSWIAAHLEWAPGFED